MMSPRFLVLSLLALFLVVGCFDRGQLRITHAWAVLDDQAIEMTGYLEIENPGKDAVEIVSAASEAFEAVKFYLHDGSQYTLVETLTVPGKGDLVLDGENGRLGFSVARQTLNDGDHLPLALAVRLHNGQLMTLEAELHVHRDHDATTHEHAHH